MNKYYSSSSYFVYEAIFGILFCMLIGVVLFTSYESAFIKTSAVLFSILAVVLIVMYLRIIVFDIFFNEEDIFIEYHLKNKKAHLSYSDLTEIKYISAHKAPAMNRVKFKTKEGIESKKFLSIALDDEFVEFINWLKSKNPKIKVSVTPSDHYLNEKLFAPKYRKYVKETL
ncbi:hypothetical protein [Flagellimonas beolgyonensis]|uniref:hypothetical protein n=1 Tax=Flagellimonas beolgyonensis TaxID=864064 RepID=UPI003D65FFDF